MTPTQPPAHDDLRARHVECLQNLLAHHVSFDENRKALKAAIAALSALPEAGEAVALWQYRARDPADMMGKGWHECGAELYERRSELLWRYEFRALYATPQPAPAIGSGDAVAWRCFHCDEAFNDREAAAVHFGTHEGQRPACLIDAAAYRIMEAREARYAEEDADVHRSMRRMEGEHRQALQRAEEAGYARGLRDSGNCPCAATPPAAVSQPAEPSK